MAISSCSTVYLTGEKKWPLPSRGEEDIKSLPLGNIYEKTLIGVFVVCGFSVVKWQFLSCVDMSQKIFELCGLSLKFQSLFQSVLI